MTIVVLAFTFLSAVISFVAGIAVFALGNLVPQIIFRYTGIWIELRVLAIAIGFLTFIILEWSVLSDIVKS